MQNNRYTGVAILYLFFFLVFAIAFLFSNRSPAMIIGGENSVGSWMSGVLLVISATTTAIIASKFGGGPGWSSWYFLPYSPSTKIS